MEPETLAAMLGGAAAAGFGALASVRALPDALAARRFLRTLEPPDDEDPARGHRPGRPAGRPRDTSVAGFFGDAIRHVDGSYSMFWAVSLSETLLKEDIVRDRECDDLARLLAKEKPTGTVIQFRRSVGPDRGEVIDRHLGARAERRGAHGAAGLLHDMGVSYYRELARLGIFRRDVLTLCVRVPSPHVSDNANNGLAAFVPSLVRDVRRYGVRQASAAWRTAKAETLSDRIVRRLQDDEAEARAAAERVFRDVEAECPLSLRRLTTGEMWRALYLGHSLAAASVPALGQGVDGSDLRDLLCGESVHGGGWYLLHGNVPVTLVTMFSPPQPLVTSTVLRRFVSNASMTFRHTMLVDFVTLGRDEAKRRLDRRINQVERTTNKSDGGQKASFEARKAMTQLSAVRGDITGGTDALLRMRCSVVVFGEHANTKAELKQSLKDLAENAEKVVSALRRIEGADASIEEPVALRALYEKTLIGEADAEPTGREFDEVSDSLAAFVASEASWRGAKRPHTLCSTVTGHLTGFDLFDLEETGPPVGYVLGQPGSGKSVLMARIINDVLANFAGARVKAVDFGESFGPAVAALGGRHLRFVEDEVRTLNIWDYPGLQNGEPPPEAQTTLVVDDTMRLARAEDALAEDIITIAVRTVYSNEVARNYPGRPEKHEPTLSHLLGVLKNYPWTRSIRDRAEALSLALEKYRDHSWLDAPTDESYAEDSPFDVFELDSLDRFPKAVKESMAFRVAARLIRAIGQKRPDGTYAPTLIVFDEMWKIRQFFPAILDALRKGTRQGRKEMAVVLLATHAYEDLEALWDVLNTAGIRIIGKQSSNIDRLVSDARLSPAAAANIHAIRNVIGLHTQFIISLDSSDGPKVEMIQLELSPAELWTFTTNAHEKNARARVRALRPDWQMVEVIAWLAANYPRGLINAGLERIDESRLERGGLA